MEEKMIEGVIIGASGGSLAGIMVYSIQYFHKKISDRTESKRIRKWLQENTSKDEFRSTRAIASWNNLPLDRVQYLCSRDALIKLSTGRNEDLWILRSKITEPIFE